MSPPPFKHKVDPDLSVSKLALCSTPAVAAIKKYSMSPQNLQYRTIVGTIVGVIIANVAVLLRLLARRVGRLALQVDDYLIMIALLFHWGIVIGGILMLVNGMGLPLNESKPSQLIVLLKTQYAGGFFYTLTILFTKLSILLMYKRLFDNELVRILVVVTGALVSSWAIAVCATVAVTCVPVRKVWIPELPGRCIDLTAFYLGAQIPNILTDVVLLVIPIVPIMKLRLGRAQKVGLIVIFGLGFITTIFAITRLVYLILFNHSTSQFTLAIVDTSVWTCVEPAVGILATCLTNMRPLMRRIVHDSKKLSGRSISTRQLALQASEIDNAGCLSNPTRSSVEVSP